MQKPETSEGTLFRIGAAAIVASAILGPVGQVLHPQPDPKDPEAFARAAATTSNWTIIHLLGGLSLIILAAGLVALFRSIEDEPARGLAWLGLASSLIGGGVASVWLAVDGIAVKRMADAWAIAPATEKAAAFRALSALEETGFALFSLIYLVDLGLPVLLFGLAVALSRVYPRWLGWLGAVIGAGTALCGLAQVFTGRDSIVSHLLIPLTAILAGLWALVMGGFLWRRADDPVQLDPAAQARPLAP
jgi:hypothetical protein